MKQLTNKEYDEWQKYKTERSKGRIITSDTIRFICEANDMNPEKIGEYFLSLYCVVKTVL